MRKIVLALGGNALIPKSSKGTVEEQMNAAREAILKIGWMLKENRVVITHGNGPQVGNLLLQQWRTQDEITPMPLDVLDAMTQGQIGYFIASAISLLRLHSATLVTRVVVDSEDPAFKKPTKPIGPFYKTKPKDGKQYIWDAGRGYRLVVPSPKPIKVREHDAIEALLERGFTVIAVGGGGIPIKKNGEGLEAVIDKDRATALLAKQIKADLLIFITSVDAVYLNFGKKDQKEIRKMTTEEAKMYAKRGEFAEGSMLPKVESCIDYVEATKGTAIICSIDNVDKAVRGEAGTIIID